MAEPQTPDEWQEAVDAAHLCMLLYSARDEHGLVDGGPEIKVDRCVDLLERGKELGYEPRSEPEDLRAFKDEWEIRPSHRSDRIRTVEKFTGRTMS